MSYTATVYNVMIASPGDVAAERVVIRDVLAEWNAVHAKTRGVVLLPLSWETHSSPEMGDRAQAIINRQVLSECDLLVGVFWTRIGTATGDHVSGSVEEIEEHISKGMPAMLYFSKAPAHLETVDTQQWEKLKSFKKSCSSRGLVNDYVDVPDFRAKFYRHLQLRLNKDNDVLHQGDPKSPKLPPEAIDLLMEAVKDDSGLILYVETLAGRSIVTNQRSFLDSADPRVNAAWESAFYELETAGLIAADSYKRELFKVTKRGYDVADLLRSRPEG